MGRPFQYPRDLLSGWVEGADLTTQFPSTCGGGTNAVTVQVYKKCHEWSLLTVKPNGLFSVLLDSV